jgi:hypothetical protein
MGIEQRRIGAVLPGGGRAGNGENARADHRADAESDEAPGAESALEARAFGVCVFYQGIDIFRFE